MSQQHDSVFQGQLPMLPLCDRSCRSNCLPLPATVYWHQANQSQGWACNMTGRGKIPHRKQELNLWSAALEVEALTNRLRYYIHTNISIHTNITAFGVRTADTVISFQLQKCKSSNRHVVWCVLLLSVSIRLSDCSSVCLHTPFLVHPSVKGVLPQAHRSSLPKAHADLVHLPGWWVLLMVTDSTL